MLTDRTIGEQSQTIRASQISPNTRKNWKNSTNLVCRLEFNSIDKKVVQELVLPLIIRKAPKQAKMESKACLQKLMQRNSTLHTATSELEIATSLHGERYTAALTSIRQDDHHASLRSAKETAAQKEHVVKLYTIKASRKTMCTCKQDMYVHGRKNMWKHKSKICGSVYYFLSRTCKSRHEHKERRKQLVYHSHVVWTKQLYTCSIQLCKMHKSSHA